MTEETEKHLASGTLELDYVDGKLVIVNASRDVEEIHNAIENAHKLFKPSILGKE